VQVGSVRAIELFENRKLRSREPRAQITSRFSEPLDVVLDSSAGSMVRLRDHLCRRQTKGHKGDR